MVGQDPPSHDAPPEPKTLADESPPLQTRERSFSSTRRNSYYDNQRTERRPSSGTSQATNKSKGKRNVVDFQDLTETNVPPPVPTQESGADLEGNVRSSKDRPQRARGDSYTNFSRPDAARRHNSTKSKRQSDPPENAPLITGSEQKRTSSRSRERQQKRRSAASTTNSRVTPRDEVEHLFPASSDESAAPVPPFAQGRSDYNPPEPEQTPPANSRWLVELYTVSYLIFFSFLGTLARVGIEWSTFYPGAPIVTPIIWANFAGSFLMGFLAEDKKLFRDEWASLTTTTPRAEKRQSKQSRRSAFSQDLESLQKAERAKIKKTLPLYIGLTTGFCGCFTSFSVFARDMFLALSNDLPTPINHPSLPSASTSVNLPRNGGYSFEAVVAVILSTLALSIGGLIAGAHVALFLEDYTPRISRRFTRIFLDRLIVFLAWGCWLGAVFLAIWPPDRPGGPVSAGSWANETWRGVAIFSLVFAPLGCLLRYYASLKLNALVPSFPLGTFAVNMLGSAILAMCWDIQHVGVGQMGSIGGGILGCQILQGIQDGFTGCLTTISTWVAEINGLRRRHAYNYALASVVGGLGLMVIIMGSVRWTVGWSTPVCATGYTSKY